MPIYTNTTFTGHYPVGTAAIVRASDRTEAALKLNIVLQEHGLKGDALPEDMIPFLGTQDQQVRILNNGNY